jgi:hypothetical protein
MIHMTGHVLSNDNGRQNILYKCCYIRQILEVQVKEIQVRKREISGRKGGRD